MLKEKGLTISGVKKILKAKGTIVVTEITNDQNKNNFIVSTLRRGYKIKTTENQVIYIKKALVKVYEYQKKEDNINS